MRKKKDCVSLKQRVIIVSFLILSVCACKTTPLGEKFTLPVYFDPQLFYQINITDVSETFPFEIDTIVEMKGFMVFHGKPAGSETDFLPQIRWSASIYPYGEYLEDDRIRVQLQSVSDRNQKYELDWAIDNDTRLFVVSDKAVPSELFISPQNGDTTVVCLLLLIQPESNPVDPVPGLLRLIPAGETVDGLILAEVQKCDP